MNLGTRTKFPLEILTMTVISVIVYLHTIILESSWNTSETTQGNRLLLIGTNLMLTYCMKILRISLEILDDNNVEDWYEIQMQFHVGCSQYVSAMKV